jgi:hypothetical protein
MIVYEYILDTSIDGKNRVTGWKPWDTTILSEKKKFEINQKPFPQMNCTAGIFDSDKQPLYVLLDDGALVLDPVPEQIKIKNPDVLERRFKNDYCLQKQVDILNIEDKNNPEYLEFKRRKKQIEDLRRL